jgi:hypothetical protein
MASFLCADWFLAKYAKNYFAKNLLPRSAAHMQAVHDMGIEHNVVCMACWHRRREVALENEFHVTCVCPEYAQARSDLTDRLQLGRSLSTFAGFCKLLATDDTHKLSVVCSFLIRARQTRRRLKTTFEQLNEKFIIQNFAAKRTAWRLKGKPTCRHGVLFTHLPPTGCKCMKTDSDDSDWQYAKYMPALNTTLKCIVAVRFERQAYKRLGIVQAEARTLRW